MSRHECLQTESGGTEQCVDCTVQVAAAPDPAPRRRQARLPRSHAGVGRPSVLDEEQLALGPQHASHLPESPDRVRHRAEGPCGDHRVGDPFSERDRLGLPLDPRDGHGGPDRPALRHPEQRGRWIERAEALHPRTVVREVQAGAHADLDHGSGRERHDPRPLRGSRPASKASCWRSTGVRRGLPRCPRHSRAERPADRRARSCRGADSR
jgi:hypothetical protein